jgi:transcription-repair coupling factor (superfamily II helicase)
MAGLRTLQDVDSIIEEMADRFGSLPTEVENLIFQIRAKILATHANVDSITSENGQILIRISVEQKSAEMAWPDIETRVSKRGIWMRRDEDIDWQDQLLEILMRMARIAPPGER